jgi:hypothetical protein
MLEISAAVLAGLGVFQTLVSHAIDKGSIAAAGGIVGNRADGLPLHGSRYAWRCFRTNLTKLDPPAESHPATMPRT